MSQELLYQVDDDIATITFNGPDRMNALTHEFCSAYSISALWFANSRCCISGPSPPRPPASRPHKPGSCS
jgi:hypothetical protein